VTVGSSVGVAGSPAAPIDVTLTGSVNTEGQNGTWWFVYGTTPQFGQTTALTNLILNPSFEHDTVGSAAVAWSSTHPSGGGWLASGSTITVTAADRFTGTKSCQVVCPTSAGAIARVAGFPKNASGTSVSVTTATAGDLVVIGGRYSNSGTAVTGVSGGGVTTWQKVTDNVNSASFLYGYMWWGVVTTPGTSTVSITTTDGGTSSSEFTVDSFTASSSTGWSVDVSGNGGQSSGTPTMSSLTPSSGGNELYWGWTFSNGSVSSGGTSGFTYSSNQFGDGLVMENTTVSGTTQPALTAASGALWTSVAALFYPTGGGTLHSGAAAADIPVTAGQTYYASISVKLTAGTSALQVLVGENQGLFATHTVVASTTASAWTTYAASFTAATTGTATLFVNLLSAASTTFLIDDAMVSPGAGTPAYFDGDSAGCYWTGTPGDSTSTNVGTAPAQSFTPPAAGSLTNYVPDPSMRYDPTGASAQLSASSWSQPVEADYFIEGASEISAVNTEAFIGSQSLQVSTNPNAAGPQGAEIYLSTLPAGTYTLSAWVLGSSPGRPLYLFAGPGTAAASANVALEFTQTTEWQQVNVTFESDGTNPTTVGVSCGVFHPTEVFSYPTTWWMDAVMVTAGAGIQPYFDGDTPGYKWSAQPGLSTSVPVVPTPQFLSQTVTAVVTNLVVGQTYYYAVAVSTPGGTVIAAPLTFVYAAPSTPSSVSTVATQNLVSGVSVPHFSWPFRIRHGSPHGGTNGQITSNDGAYVVQQDTDGDVLSCVNAIAACTIGEFPEAPSFGIPDFAFQEAPLDMQALTSSVLRWEPRANQEAISTLVPDGTYGNWNVYLGVNAASPPINQ